MSEETKTHEPEKEVTPEWATNLQKALEDLPSRLSEMLNPQPEEPSNEIPVPQPPQPPQPEPTTEPEPLPEPQQPVINTA